MFVVAGVSGNVGATVARELINQKQPVKVIVRDSTKADEWTKLGAQVAVGSLEDASFLTTTLKDANGFFTLLPPNFAMVDFYGYQRRVSDSIAFAVKTSGVKNVVLLSSVGADLPEGNGPIRGLHYLENALRKTNCTLTAVRAGYFQENVGNSVGAAREMGIYPNFSASADAAFPMIATKDIGMFVAKELVARPTKSEIVDLHGPAYSPRQVAEKLGTQLNKKLNVIDIPEQGWVDGMMKGGMPKHMADVYAEMYKGFNSGAIKPKGDRMVTVTTTIDETIKNVISKNSGVTQNPVGWFEIPTKDLHRAKAFYENVLGVQLSLMEMGPSKMAMFPAGRAAPGAAGTLLYQDGFEPSHKGSVIYLSVTDVDATLAKIKDRGGKVLMPRTAIGEWGFIAHFEDSEGNRVALHSQK